MSFLNTRQHLFQNNNTRRLIMSAIYFLSQFFKIILIFHDKLFKIIYIYVCKIHIMRIFIILYLDFYFYFFLLFKRQHASVLMNLNKYFTGNNNNRKFNVFRDGNYYLVEMGNTFAADGKKLDLLLYMYVSEQSVN